MKGDYVWARTLLSVYRYLERIAGAIDKIVEQTGLGSANICGQNYFYNNIFTVSQKMIDLSERKVTLINVKLLVENSLRKIDPEDAEILIEKFFDGVKTKDIVERHGISMRTAFRKIDCAIKSFASALVLQGFDTDRLQQTLKDEHWIIQVHDRLLAKDEEDVSLSEMFLKKAVVM